MPQPRRSIFRKEALERLSSPDRLDRLIEIVRPRDWVALAATAFLVIFTLVWSVVGRLPTTVRGHGVLIRPGKVVPIQAPASGKLVRISTRPGDLVSKGGLIGIIAVAPPSERDAAVAAPAVDEVAVVSDVTGRVLEIPVRVSQTVAPGQRVASIEVDDPGAVPLAVSYFSMRDGKRITPAMSIRLAPDPVDRARFGSIFGTVTATSPFPVTKESVARTVGSAEVAEALVQGPTIEVVAELAADPSTFSGYRWSSSSGPRMRLDAGTTLTASVTVEERAPISYVLPFWRSLVAFH